MFYKASKVQQLNFARWHPRVKKAELMLLLDAINSFITGRNPFCDTMRTDVFLQQRFSSRTPCLLCSSLSYLGVLHPSVTRRCLKRMNAHNSPPHLKKPSLCVCVCLRHVSNTPSTSYPLPATARGARRTRRGVGWDQGGPRSGHPPIEWSEAQRHQKKNHTRRHLVVCHPPLSETLTPNTLVRSPKNQCSLRATKTSETPNSSFLGSNRRL